MFYKHSKAHREPGTAEPYVSRPIHLSSFQGFLILMSDGLYEAYEAWTHRPTMVNDDIAHLVAQEMKKTSDLSVVAQNVVESVKNLFRTTCKKDKRSGRIDDITLIVRNFGYPTPIPHAQSYPGNMVTVHSSVPSQSVVSGQPSMHNPPPLHPSISFPSHMHHAHQPIAPNPPAQQSPYAMPGAYQYSSPGGDPRGYSMTQPHMSLSSGGGGGGGGGCFPPSATFKLQIRTFQWTIWR